MKANNYLKLSINAIWFVGKDSATILLEVPIL